MENKTNLLKELCRLLIADRKNDALAFAETYLPFTTPKNIGIKEYEKLVSISSEPEISEPKRFNFENNPGCVGTHKILF